MTFFSSSQLSIRWLLWSQSILDQRFACFSLYSCSVSLYNDFAKIKRPDFNKKNDNKFPRFCLPKIAGLCFWLLSCSNTDFSDLVSTLSFFSMMLLLLVLAPMYLDPSSSLAIEDDFDDEEAWDAVKMQAGTGPEFKKNNIQDDSDDDDSDVTISDIFPLVTSTPPAHMKGGRRQWNTEADGSGADGLVASTPPTSALVTKLFPQMKPKKKVTVSIKIFKAFPDD